MAFALRILGACVVLAYIFWLNYIERRQWWTLKLRVSSAIPGQVILIAAIGLATQTVIDILSTGSMRSASTQLNLALFVTSFLCVLFYRLLPLANDDAYLTLRWTAWTGPSRTGIPASMTKYLGDRADWASLVAASRNLEKHSVESFVRFTSPFSNDITFDPTEILKARLRLDEDAETDWLPRSDVKVGVYSSAQVGQSLSLLWGRDLGFAPRCSRGIIAVPPPLMKSQPRLKNGIDGRPICLALGILSRNKGLDPHRLVCNLNNAERLRQFEENSRLWPRPTKTLRSFYHAEMSKYFAGLGTSYVCAATELALLLADSKAEMTRDWLNGHLEHQDLRLNNRIATLGADADDLSRLYRGQYVAMLISLSEHRPGITLRPEITVYKAMYALEGVRDFPTWLSDPYILERELTELEILGDRGLRLVEAAV